MATRCDGPGGTGRRGGPGRNVGVAIPGPQSGRLGSVYEASEKWVGGQGLTVAGAPRETYWTDFFSAAPDDEVFDVAWPVG